MADKICVYTCITGDYDDLHEVEVADEKVDFLCFTNNKKLKSKTWRIVYIEDKGLDNCRLARKIKTIGHPIIDKNYNVSIWTDASTTWVKPPSEFARTFLKDVPLAIFKHSSRNSVREEAIACLKLRKDDKKIIQKTLGFYGSVHYPDDNGLCESTVYVKRHNDAVVKETMQTWFDMIKNYSRRDQLSFNYAVWKTGLKFNYINLNVWDNDWLRTTKHTPHKEIRDCHVYFGDSEQNFDFSRYEIYHYKQSGTLYQISGKVPADCTNVELSLCDVIGVRYYDLRIKPSFSKIELFGFVDYDGRPIFCTNHSLMTVCGNFKKGQAFNLSVNMELLNNSDINKTIEYLWSNWNLQKNNFEASQKANRQIIADVQHIMGSKRWKAVNLTGRIIPFRKKK